MSLETSIDFNSFAKGEVSPRLKGRSDYAGYYAALETCLNFAVLPQGGVTRRPGTLFVGLAKDQTDTPFTSRCVRFQFSTVQAYMLVFTAGNIRVYMNDAPVLSGGLPVDIATPYGAADLAFLNFTRSADTLFLYGGACPGNGGVGYPLMTLTRSSHVAWTLATPAILDGPYLTNVGSAINTVTPSGTSGSVTLTAASGAGINNGAGFLASDVGRAIRLQQTHWAWLVISAFTDALHVTAAVQPAVANGAAGALDGTTASVQFALGQWSATTGYAYCGCFWQNRLMAMGTDNQPNAVNGSVTADFFTFAPTQSDNSVASSNAVSWVIDDDEVNAIRWVAPAGSAAAMQLGIGTTGSEDILQPATTSQGLGPANVQVYRETKYGSPPIEPAVSAAWPAVSNPGAQRVGKAILFPNAPGRKVHEWQWAWAVNGFLGPDLAVDSEHITRSNPPSLPGIIASAYQQHPYGINWYVRGDGQLIGLTYLPEQQVKAWHRHQLGGQYYGGPPIVESLDCIPSPDGSYTELWLTVLRTIAGAPTRTVEVLTRYFDGLPQEQAFFGDCGAVSPLTYPNASLSMSAMAGNGVVFSASAAAFSSTDQAKSSLIRVNNGVAVVRAYTDSQHVTGDWLTQPTMSKPAAANGWSCTPQGTTVTGLAWLAGETVKLTGDGADCGASLVGNTGSASLQNSAAALVNAGLPATYVLATMPFVPKQAAESVAGRIKRFGHLYIRVLETLEAFTYGQKRTDPATGIVDFPGEMFATRNAADPAGAAPPLISAIRRVNCPGGFDMEGQIYITGNGPLPLTVLAIGAAAELADVPEQQAQ